MSDISTTPATGLSLPAPHEGAHGSFVGDLWALCAPYFRSREAWIAWSLLVAVIVFNVAGVGLEVIYNDWSGRFYNTFETKDEAAFFKELWGFGWIALAFIAVGIIKYFSTEYLKLRWRRWLTDRYIGRWLENRAYYRIEIARNADNPDQRIADDVRLLLHYTMQLSMGLLSAVLTLFSFLFILWTLSGPITVTLAGSEITIPGYMVWVALIYAIVGTLFAHLVGRPLIPLNFRKQKLEADFRFDLVRTRENAEPIALYAGEAREDAALRQRFGLVLRNYWSLIIAELRLSIYSIGYNQVAVIFPFVVAGPRFFAGAITLGTLMQISQAFGQVQGALSYFITNYASLAEWRSVINRLRGFEVAIAQVSDLPEGPQILPMPGGNEVATDGLVLALPDGRRLANDVNVTFRRGERVLIRGASGSGKSTLFRAISGIWPYGSGKVSVPDKARVLFLPQKPYLPIGALRDVVRYPDIETPVDDAAIRKALADVGLPALADRLDEVAHWANRLSGGEQQRLAAARALLFRPEFLFMDEASSALDEPGEAQIYELLRERLPDAAIVSIGHRTSLRQWHERQLEMIPGKDGPGQLVESR